MPTTIASACTAQAILVDSAAGLPVQPRHHNDRALTGNQVRPMNSTAQPPSAAGEHFANAERILAALPLVKRGERDRHVQVALVHATLAAAAGVLEETVTDRRTTRSHPRTER